LAVSGTGRRRGPGPLQSLRGRRLWTACCCAAAPQRGRPGTRGCGGCNVHINVFVITEPFDCRTSPQARWSACCRWSMARCCLWTQWKVRGSCAEAMSKLLIHTVPHPAGPLAASDSGHQQVMRPAWRPCPAPAPPKPCRRPALGHNPGPLAQTKFVLSKALARGLAPLVVLNKVDRPAATQAGGAVWSPERGGAQCRDGGGQKGRGLSAARGCWATAVQRCRGCSCLASSKLGGRPPCLAPPSAPAPVPIPAAHGLPAPRLTPKRRCPPLAAPLPPKGAL
jgi:hypothetical protein